MKTRKILIYKISGGELSLEKKGSISITKTDKEEDSLELKGLGSLISDLKHNETIGILITDDTDTTDLGNVQNDNSDESNGLIPITLPESESSEALLIPTTGPSMRWTLSAIKTGDISTFRTFIAKVRKWIADGSSLSKDNLTYNSDLDGTGFSVRATDWSKRWVAGNPRILNYTLTLVQGSFI